MKYVIRKVPERNTEYLERLIPDAIVYSDVAHKGAIKSFVGAIYMAKDNAVYIQDDMILCKNFASKAEEYINVYPDNVIVFSNFTHDIESQHVTSENFYSPDEAGWLLCTYIPSKIALGFCHWYMSDQYRRLVTNSRIERWQLRQYDDLFFRKYLNDIKQNVFVVIPNLAGHPKNHSVIDNRRPKITPNFDYENAEV